MTTFDRHEIRGCVEAPGFGSWLLMRRHEDGGWTSTFWCRVTAADGLLCVSGDFHSITFRGHLAHDDDPIDRVAWMGGCEGLDHYVIEKARAGSGRDACTWWSVDEARANLREMIAERNAQLEAAVREDYGDDPASWPDDELCCSTVAAMTEGLDASTSYDGRDGVREILNAIWCSEHMIEMEDVYEIGERPSSALTLAHLAVQKLHALLQEEQS